ncbi:hypothetical protein GCM10023231_41860 [Olivibacter ginsenosidimutans]|uniref:Outer membrane lipoprotein-sorting protein n=1 Tax=Olivibacter ginsenosidimutans TaxID=1176537 RepID=A0ABP9CDI4_9SPHI
MKKLLVMGLLLLSYAGRAQEVDADLMKVKKRLDTVQQFTATVVLDLDVPFIRMPTKTAQMHYEKGKQTRFSSEDFVMLPKRGLDFSFDELFKYPFITVDRGTEMRNGQSLKIVNVIPTDKRAELALATLYLDVKNRRIMQSEINTRKEGSYTLSMHYTKPNDILPDYVEATFAVERLKIPFNFMGKDTKIDRQQMKAQDKKTGVIKIRIKEYRIYE